MVYIVVMEVNGRAIEPGANLEGANLSHANLRGANLTDNLFWQTIMPDGKIAGNYP